MSIITGEISEENDSNWSMNEWVANQVQGLIEASLR